MCWRSSARISGIRRHGGARRGVFLVDAKPRSVAIFRWTVILTLSVAGTALGIFRYPPFGADTELFSFCRRKDGQSLSLDTDSLPRTDNRHLRLPVAPNRNQSTQTRSGTPYRGDAGQEQAGDCEGGRGIDNQGEMVETAGIAGQPASTTVIRQYRPMTLVNRLLAQGHQRSSADPPAADSDRRHRRETGPRVAATAPSAERRSQMACPFGLIPVAWRQASFPGGPGPADLKSARLAERRCIRSGSARHCQPDTISPAPLAYLYHMFYEAQ